MARRSRAIVETARPKYRVWRIAIYIRLSKEDMRCLDESESVTNQRQIIEDHIAGFNDGDEYIIVDEYVDATVIIGLKQNPTYGRRFSPIFLFIRAFCGAKRKMLL